MATSVTFPSTTQNFALPLLFAGQAQKEFFLNQALGIVDALIASGVVAISDTPPIDPIEGSAHIVGANAINDWSGHDDKIACWIGGAWTYLQPPHGFAVYDQSEQKRIVFRDTWQGASEPTPPQGGAVIDAEARIAIGEITEALRISGILAQTA